MSKIVFRQSHICSIATLTMVKLFFNDLHQGTEEDVDEKKVKLNVKAINKTFSESSETPHYGNDEPTVWVSWVWSR